MDKEIGRMEEKREKRKSRGKGIRERGRGGKRCTQE